jgi:2-(1,2-epoxy-1,2-dihydrophenyl)acetyl-CoA isomerase
MSFQYIKYEKDAALATILLNRPKRLNALIHAMIREIHAALKDADEDDAVRVVLLKGEGRAFCSGDDMLEMVDHLRPLPMQGREDFRPEGYHSLVIALRELRKPVVASVQGYALGAGFELALACDFIIAEEDAKFGMVLMTRGMVGGTYLLPRVVGLHRAIELILLGETFDAKRADSLGFLYKVAPSGELEEETLALARRLAAGPTAAIGLAKTALHRGLHMSLREGMEYQGLALTLSIMTDDFREGVLAFTEKRQPDYTGK